MQGTKEHPNSEYISFPNDEMDLQQINTIMYKTTIMVLILRHFVLEPRYQTQHNGLLKSISSSNFFL